MARESRGRAKVYEGRKKASKPTIYGTILNLTRPCPCVCVCIFVCVKTGGVCVRETSNPTPKDSVAPATTPRQLLGFPRYAMTKEMQKINAGNILSFHFGTVSVARSFCGWVAV